MYTSPSTCDPGDIFETIEFLQKSNIRVSVVGWGAEVFILREVASKTEGIYHVASNKAHFQELLHDHCPPPPTLNKFAGAAVSLVSMGFPQKLPETAVGLCSW